MTTFDMIALPVYIVGWFVAARIAHHWLMHDQGRVDGDDVFPIVIAAIMWPVIAAFGVVVLAFYGAYRLATGPMPSLPRLRRRSRADQERIQELERALGIEGSER